MRRRARPEAPQGNRRRQFLSDNRNSRYVESRARSAAHRRAARRGRDDARIGESAIPARLTDNPLISLETAKEKVWKSLEKLGKAWGHGDRLLIPLMGRRPLAREAFAARRGGGKSSRNPLKTNHRAGIWRPPRPRRPPPRPLIRPASPATFSRQREKGRAPYPSHSHPPFSKISARPCQMLAFSASALDAPARMTMKARATPPCEATKQSPRRAASHGLTRSTSMA